MVRLRAERLRLTRWRRAWDQTWRRFPAFSLVWRILLSFTRTLLAYRVAVKNNNNNNNNKSITSSTVRYVWFIKRLKMCEALASCHSAGLADNRIIVCVCFCLSNAVDYSQLAKDLLHPTPEEERRRHKKKRLVQSPNSYFMDVKCPGLCSSAWRAHQWVRSGRDNTQLILKGKFECSRTHAPTDMNNDMRCIQMCTVVCTSLMVIQVRIANEFSIIPVYGVHRVLPCDSRTYLGVIYSKHAVTVSAVL